MKRRLVRAAALASLLGLCGFLVAASGVIPIEASSGHWAITTWFLRFSMRRSIATHTLAMEAPELGEPWLVMKGAGMYETACRSCHGAPGWKPSPLAITSTPPAPDLRATQLTTKELFYVIKHGVKFTGMPAWPAQTRDDEVRALTAFLRALPELDATSYRHLVHGEAAPRHRPAAEGLAEPLVNALTTSCARCHGFDGLGRGNAAFPKLAGQRREYLVASLEAYARRARHSGVMAVVAAALTPDEMAGLAEFYSQLAPADSAEKSTAHAVARGRRIAEQGVPERRVPACVDCHGPGVEGIAAAYPLLAGQYADFLVLQLELFKAQKRGGSPYAHLMRPVATRMTAQEMRDVARYYSSLPIEDLARR